MRYLLALILLFAFVYSKAKSSEVPTPPPRSLSLIILPLSGSADESVKRRVSDIISEKLDLYLNWQVSKADRLVTALRLKGKNVPDCDSVDCFDLLSTDFHQRAGVFLKINSEGENLITTVKIKDYLLNTIIYEGSLNVNNRQNLGEETDRVAYEMSEAVNVTFRSEIKPMFTNLAEETNDIKDTTASINKQPLSLLTDIQFNVFPYNSPLGAFLLFPYNFRAGALIDYDFYSEKSIGFILESGFYLFGSKEDFNGNKSPVGFDIPFRVAARFGKVFFVNIWAGYRLASMIAATIISDGRTSKYFNLDHWLESGFRIGFSGDKFIFSLTTTSVFGTHQILYGKISKNIDNFKFSPNFGIVFGWKFRNLKEAMEGASEAEVGIE